jgi:hypothetical protein
MPNNEGMPKHTKKIINVCRVTSFIAESHRLP